MQSGQRRGRVDGGLVAYGIVSPVKDRDFLQAGAGT